MMTHVKHPFNMPSTIDRSLKPSPFRISLVSLKETSTLVKDGDNFARGQGLIWLIWQLCLWKMNLKSFYFSTILSLDVVGVGFVVDDVVIAIVLREDCWFPKTNFHKKK